MDLKSRPSQLRIDRHLTGEHHDPEVARLLAEDPAFASTQERELDEARHALGPLDVGALRARAARLATAPPTPANNSLRYVFVTLLMAALLLLALLPSRLTTPETVDPAYVGVRGQTLSIYHLEEGRLRPYDGRALGAGDVLGFRVDPGAADGVVLLSIDGRGTLTVFYPDSGDTPEPVDGPGPLPGSVVLDDAPGPEIFVALFGWSVPDARRATFDAWKEGGADGLLDWARNRGDAAATVVNKR